jgi:outer membrane protein assembly factor BamB
MLTTFAVVPVLIGPMQVLLTILPGLIVAALSALVSVLHPRAVWNTLKVLWRQKLQVAVALLLLVGLAWGGAKLWSLYGPGEAEEEVSAQEGRGAHGRRAAARSWPAARGDLRRRGAVYGEPGPTRGGVVWQRKAGSKEMFLASPAVVGNRVYVASADLDIIGASGKLYCFDADTGNKVWALKPDGYRPTFSSPVVVGTRLVCGEGLHDTKDARVVCLDLTSDREPKILWTFEAGFHVECTPVIDGDRVFVNAGDNGIWCLALEPGPDGKARALWHVGSKENPDPFADAETALAVVGGKVYVGLGRGGNGLVELDAATGKELRRLTFDQPVLTPPAIADGKLYLGMGYGDFVVPWDEACDKLKDKLKKRGKTTAEIDRLSPGMVAAGTVACVDLATWKVDWTFKTRGVVLGAIAVTDERLYVTGCDGWVYGLSRGGKLLAEWNSGAAAPASPAVTDKHVYVVNNAGMLFALDRQTLEPAWQLRLGPPPGNKYDPGYLSSPVVARGHVYVGTPTNGMVCAGEPGEQAKVLPWPSALGGAGRSGTADESGLSVGVGVQWQLPGLVRGPAAVLGERLLVGVAEGPDAGLACFRVGARAEKAPEPLWKTALQGGVWGSPVAFKDLAWCVAGKPGADGRQLHALDVASGKPLWQAAVGPQASGVLLAVDDAVLVQDQEAMLTSFNRQGQRQWSQKVGRLSHAPAVTRTMVVAAVAQPAALVALDRPTGRVLWSRPLEAPPSTAPLVRKDRVLVGTHAALEERSLLDGAPVAGWHTDGGGVSADFALQKDVLLYVNDQGELVVLRAASGAVLLRLPGAVPGRPPLVARDSVVYLGRVVQPGSDLSEDVVVPGRVAAGGAAAVAAYHYAGKEEYQIVTLQRDAAGTVVAADEPRPWFDSEGLGALTTPWVLVDGCAYAGSTVGGLLKVGRE